MTGQELIKLKLPEAPGVYFFIGNNNEVLYIGRATSLKDRVKSYFAADVIHTRGARIVDMVTKAVTVDYIQTDSVLEAIIQEANLIKKYQPHANVDEKDDKSFNYVVFTDEDFPKIMLVRGKEVEALSTTQPVLSGQSLPGHAAIKPFQGHAPTDDVARGNVKLQPTSQAGGGQSHRRLDGFVPEGRLPDAGLAGSKKLLEVGFKYTFGPYPNGLVLKEGLKIIRKIFQYRDAKCRFDSAHGRQTRGCFNYQIGLCPGPCAGVISKQEYGKTIQNLKLFFEGRKGDLLKKLEKDMKAYAKVKEFERANEVKRKMFALTHIQDVSLIKAADTENDSRVPQTTPGEYATPFAKGDSRDRSTGFFRIEGYDIAHMSGQNTGGVMVVLEDRAIKKSDYRLFKIKRKKGVDDVAHLKEVLDRRLNHAEWHYPNLIVVDGNKMQKNAAEELLGQRGFDIAVVAVTKDDRHKPETILGDRELIERYKKEILLVNSEAHRFAIKYHRKIRGKKLLA